MTKASVVEVKPGRFAIKHNYPKGLSNWIWGAGQGWSYRADAKIWWTKAKVERQCLLINMYDL